MVEQRQAFGHHANAPFQLGGIGCEPLAEQTDSAGRRINQSRQTTDGGAFARAVRAEKTEQPSGGHSERKAINGQQLAVTLGQIFGADCDGPLSAIRHSLDGIYRKNFNCRVHIEAQGDEILFAYRLLVSPSGDQVDQLFPTRIQNRFDGFERKEINTDT
jgi:hypothetical protein